MDNYITDRETLARFVDELIKKKPLPVNSVEELETLREQTIKSLDDQIGVAIVSQFTNANNAEFNRLLDDDNATEEDYDRFFAAAGINLEDTVTNTMKTFAIDFLEGADNA